MGSSVSTVKSSLVKPSFEESYPEVARIVASRKGAWTYVSLMEWSDVSSIVTTRIWKQWHYYRPEKGPLENWANTVISRALVNLRRDLALRYARPCVKECSYNLGGDACGLTKSRTQCAECPLYAEWEKGRRHQFNIKSTVALDNHIQEVHSKPGDNCDIEGVKDMIDQRMKQELTTWEYKLYIMLYIKHLSPTDASVGLQQSIKTWKRAPRKDEEWGYQFILEKQRWFKELMMDILKREGHI